MYQLKSIDDTIAAIATPAGEGGIGVVRISGTQALGIADKIFKAKNGRSASQARTFTVHYGWVMDNGAVIDEALMTVMKGPKSYTGQDIVEMSCHAGPAVMRSVLECVLAAGARLAEPGEFTKRAFLNGRIDLTQAEAVIDVIRAKTEGFARVSQNQLSGELAQELNGMRDELMNMYTAVEAIINFPEDDIGPEDRAHLIGRLRGQQEKLAKLLASSRNGRILKDGIRIVLCGKPNVGKSSLLNVLLKQDRAIVTDIAGTTRDPLEESARIKGIPFQLVDTAGILEPRDLIEEEAVKRSRTFMAAADLVLLVLDASCPLDAADQALMAQLRGRPMLTVLNKTDLPVKIQAQDLPAGPQVKVSALRKQCIDGLEEAIVAAVWEGKDTAPHGIMISNLRHITALTTAQDALKEAVDHAQAASSWEIVSQGIKDAVNQLDAVTGRNIDEDLLDRIFSEFCIGK